MATLSLKISIDGGKVVKTIQLEPSTTIFDACRVIREKILEAGVGDQKDYGLFLASEEDSKKGIWLEPSRTLDYYMLRNGDVLEYGRKTRNLRVRMLDGTVKTILVDDSQVVANLMVVICSKIGITNHDEYGLVREESKEEPDPTDKPNYGTLTLRRKHHEKERDAKMEQLRKKLRTDDEVNWVEPSKTLREQGVDTSETLLLRRRLFFSDRNVDSRDPVQLNLLYAQAQHQIVNQQHPVTADKACEFAGIQCQIQFGDHKEDKHTPGFLDLKEFLPDSYVKVKGIEKKIFKEHKKHVGLSELDAKVLYTKTARDLKTYGVAFFLVKEKMKGKNKLVPRLLGITKDSVLRLDEKTKEILQTWPLTTVRRWCASPNTFTLDFGDYSDQYYSVQTSEPEQIQQVLAGYIDMIVRRRRAKEHVGIDGDQGAAMLEDAVHSNKANIIQHDTIKSGKTVNTESVAKPAVMRPGAEGAKSFALGHHTSAQQTTISGQIVTGHAPPAASQAQQTKVTSLITEPQRALLSTITSGREIIKHTEESLTRAQLPELGQDAQSIKWRHTTMDSSRQAVTSHIAAMNAATAQVVTLTSGTTEEVDHTAVGAAITTITTNLPEMTKGVQMIAALMDDNDNGERLLDATRKLCSAFTDLLKAAEPDTKEPRQNLLNAASRVGEASTSVLYTIGDEVPEDKETQDILLSLAKAVANTTAALVLKAKHVAAQCKEEQQLQTNIIACATNAALATSQLVACAKVVAPTLHNPACREQLTAAARLVAQSVERLVAACEPVQDKDGVQQLTEAAKRVTIELERLLAHCDIDRRTGTVTERAVESVLAASSLVAGASDAGDMVKQARLLGQATAHLINTIKTEAEKQPSDTQRKLLAAAKLLADATSRLVIAARQCSSAPQDREKQEALRQAAEELHFITTDYGHTRDVVGSQIARLQESARNTASCATQLVTSAQSAAQYNTNKYTQETLDEECHKLWEQVNKSVEAIRTSTSHLQLINTSSQLLRSSNLAIQASRAALPSISDAAANKHLSDTTHHLADACSDLRSAVSRARISTKGTELNAAAALIQSLQQELEEFARATDYTLLPGQTAEWACSSISSAHRGAASAAAQLVAGARGRDEPGLQQATADLAADLQQFTDGAKVALVLADREQPRRDRIVTTSREVLQSSYTLVETVKRYISHGEEQQLPNIITLAKEMTQGMERTLEAVPSHAELDAALETINETLDVLDMGEFPHSDRSYGELQSELTSTAASLNQAASTVASTCAGADARSFSERFSALTNTAMEIAGSTQDTQLQSEMVTTLKSVTINSSKLLSTVKSVSQDATRPNAKNQLMAAARAVTDSINKLVDVCTEAAPGQKECAAAMLRIESARGLLEEGVQPVNELGYHACVDAVVDASRQLSEGMSGLASAARGASGSGWGAAAGALADAACSLAECAAQAAYLVGVSDPSSAMGRAGLVDQAGLARAADHIRAACSLLADPHATQQQVVTAATAIAKHTSALCNACRAASARSSEPRAKRHFVQAAKDVANSTAALVKKIKALDNNYTPESRSECAAATAPVLEAVHSLVVFTDRAEFASVPARISAAARTRQQPILQGGREILSGAISMLEAGRSLAISPNERAHWHSLANHSKAVSDSIKALVTNIRENAPGQAECEAALGCISSQQRRLDHAALQAAQLLLPPTTKYTLQGYCEQIENSCSEMIERLEPVRTAATGQVENLGHAVNHLVSYMEPLMSAAIGAMSHVTDHVTRNQIAERSRSVAESTAMLVKCAASTANKPSSGQGEISAQISLAHTALSELSALSRELSTQAGGVGPLLECISRATHRLTEHRMSLIGSYDETDTFVQYQTRIMAHAKEIARLANDMTAKSVTDPSSLVSVAGEMSDHYEKLAADALGASATATSTDLSARLRTTVSELGDAVSELVTAGGRCRLCSDQHNKAQVANAAELVNEKVIGIVSALQSGGGGAQACIDACATLAAVVSDLDTTILFASAGTLHSEIEGDQFSSHREGILQTAKNLVEHTKLLVGGCSSQQGLTQAAHTAVNTVVSLCEVIKQGAMSLGSANPESQVLVLHAARDVTAALRDLVAATAAAAGHQPHHANMDALKHAAKRLGDMKRWSLPAKTTFTKPTKRWSLMTGLKNDYNSCDSETDIFQSDQEEELVKLLDYSSHDDDISPSVFYDNCEETITYIESKMRKPPTRVQDYNLNVKYNQAARNSLIDMNWRCLKYGENILLGEIKTLVDNVVDIADRLEEKRKIKILKKLKAETVLDGEMKRISKVIEEMDTDIEIDELAKKIQLPDVKITPKEPEVEETGLKSPVFKITKVKPLNLVLDLDAKHKIEKIDSPPKLQSPIANTNDQRTVVIFNKDFAGVKKQFWELFKDETEWWKALAKRNLEKMEETRKELERFSQHELVTGEYQKAIDQFDKDKQQLQGFIEDINKSRKVKTDLQYDKKYEDMVLKLIDFAKKDFIYKGFDPLIDQLKVLSNSEIPSRKKVVNIQDIINIYTHIDITKYTYEELCILEKHYKDIIKKYKKETSDKTQEKENIVPIKNQIPIRDVRSASPGYHRNVILKVHSTENSTKNTHQYYNNTQNIGGSLNRYKNKEHKTKNNTEIFDLTRTYPEEYYANNWWSIYEDILKNREEQFGSIDNWWQFYESILNKNQSTDEEINRIRAVVEYRNSLRKRPNSRLEQHMKMLEDIRNDQFKETEDVTTEDKQSVMVTNVTSLLKTVKAVEDEHTRGTRALESTIEAINQEIEFLHSPAASDGPTSPEELIRRTRQMTLATAQAVAAGNSGKQDLLVAAANLGRKTVLDLLRACKASAHAADSADLQDRTIVAGEAAAMAYRQLLVAVLEGHKNKLPDLSRHVAKAVADIISAADLLKGSDWVDPADPAVVAETELLSAAATIDAAANKLASLRPRKTLHHETDESLNFDEMILEAAKCIITATSALVRAASSAQRELIDQGVVARRPAQSSDDGQWSEGLVSAARLVAAAAHSLVDAANALVQGVGSEERLVSAARSVAAGTAQLLVACKVKADPAAESTRRLQSAGAEVIRSTDNLVRAARDAVARDDERSLVLNRRMVGGIAQEIDARSEVLRIEKELEEARSRLTAIRQAKYKLKTESGDETDTDVSVANAPTQRFKSPTSSFMNTTYSPNSTAFSPHTTLNTTNLSQNISQLNQSIHGSPGQNTSTYDQNTTKTTSFGQNTSNFGQNTSNFGQNTSNFGQNTSNFGQNTSNIGQNTSQTSHTEGQNGYDKYTKVEERQYTHGPTFSSFRPQEDSPKQNYEGFTTRTSVTEETVVVKSLQLPEVRKAYLVDDQSGAERVFYRRSGPPPPPPRRVSLHNYETRLYDTPRPTNEYSTTEEKRQYESSQYFSKQEQKVGYDTPKVSTPLSPKFNARELKFETHTEPIYSSLKKPTTPKSPLDGVGQTFSEHKKSTEKIPGGTIQSEYSVKSESYSSHPKTEYSKMETRQEVKSPFTTSTPAKDYSQYTFGKSTDLVKAVTPDYDRIASPYGKEVYNYGGPNFMEETTTEVKEIPNGTQKVTTTKIYSSSPVNLTTTSTKYEPIKLEGIDELSKSFDNDSRYSTLDSRFNTIDSKLSSDTSRSFMRPSEFQTSDYQATSTVSKIKKPSELVKEIDSVGNKFSKQTITSETIERKSVMTSSHKSEKSSTVTKKFGNF